MWPCHWNFCTNLCIAFSSNKQCDPIPISFTWNRSSYIEWIPHGMSSHPEVPKPTDLKPRHLCSNDTSLSSNCHGSALGSSKQFGGWVNLGWAGELIDFKWFYPEMGKGNSQLRFFLFWWGLEDLPSFETTRIKSEISWDASHQPLPNIHQRGCIKPQADDSSNPFKTGIITHAPRREWWGYCPMILPLSSKVLLSYVLTILHLKLVGAPTPGV